MSAERKNAAVSIMLDLYKRSKTRAKSLGFTTWSAYVVQLIRADVSGGGNIIVQETAETPDVPARREATYEMPKKSHGARR